MRDGTEAPPDTGGDPGAESVRHEGDARRPRYGRRRGAPPPGDWFVKRLGPAGVEPFAEIDDPPVPAPPAPLPTTPLDQLRFVAVDCETTGQTPHRLIELGAVAFTTRGHVASFETLVHCTDRINPYARRLHGIHIEQLAGAPRPEAVLARFSRFAAGAVLVEHSADAFDTRLLARSTGEPFDFHNVDTSRMAGGLWELRDTIGLERLGAELGVVHRGPHTALGDAEGTAACFLELLRRCRTLFGWTVFGDLLAYAQPPPPRLPSPYGERWRPRAAAPPDATMTATAAIASTEARGEGDGQAEGEDRPRRRRRRGGRRRGRTTEGPVEGEAAPGE